MLDMVAREPFELRRRLGNRQHRGVDHWQSHRVCLTAQIDRPLIHLSGRQLGLPTRAAQPFGANARRTVEQHDMDGTWQRSGRRREDKARPRCASNTATRTSAGKPLRRASQSAVAHACHCSPPPKSRSMTSAVGTPIESKWKHWMPGRASASSARTVAVFPTPEAPVTTSICGTVVTLASIVTRSSRDVQVVAEESQRQPLRDSARCLVRPRRTI